MVIAPFSQAAPEPLSQGEEPIKDSGTLNLSAVLRPAYPVHTLSLFKRFCPSGNLGGGRPPKPALGVGYAVPPINVTIPLVKSPARFANPPETTETLRGPARRKAWNRPPTDRAGNAILRMAARRWPGGCGADLRPQYVGG